MLYRLSGISHLNNNSELIQWFTPANYARKISMPWHNAERPT